MKLIENNSPKPVKKPYQRFDDSQYERTGCYAVDLVAACVGWHRKRNSPLKTIYLKKKFFEDFESHFKRKMPENEWDELMKKGKVFTMDGVEIRKSGLHLKDMWCDFYTKETKTDTN